MSNFKNREINPVKFNGLRKEVIQKTPEEREALKKAKAAYKASQKK